MLLEMFDLCFFFVFFVELTESTRVSWLHDAEANSQKLKCKILQPLKHLKLCRESCKIQPIDNFLAVCVHSPLNEEVWALRPTHIQNIPHW